MRLPPPEVVAQWPAPNYSDPVTRGPVLLIVLSTLTLSAVSVLGLRIFTRLRISKCYGVDDTLMILAAALAVVHTVLVIVVETRFGGDRHIWDVPLSDLTEGRKLNMAMVLFFAAACTTTKLSILFFTRRIISQTSLRAYKFAVTVAILICTTEGVVFSFIVIFQCHPIRQYWTLEPAGDSACLSEFGNLTAASIINTITDFLVVFLPIPAFWKLQFSPRSRFQIISIFAVSFMVCFAGVIRTIYTYKFLKTWDTTWAVFAVWLSSTAELNIGIICGSVPAIKPLYSRIFGRPDTRSCTVTRVLARGHTTNKGKVDICLKEFERAHRAASHRVYDEDSESQKGIFSSSSTTLK